MSRERKRFLRRLRRYERQESRYPRHEAETADAPGDEGDDARARLAVALERAAFGEPDEDGMMSADTLSDVLAILNGPGGERAEPEPDEEQRPEEGPTMPRRYSRREPAREEPSLAEAVQGVGNVIVAALKAAPPPPPLHFNPTVNVAPPSVTVNNTPAPPAPPPSVTVNNLPDQGGASSSLIHYARVAAGEEPSEPPPTLAEIAQAMGEAFAGALRDQQPPVIKVDVAAPEAPTIKVDVAAPPAPVVKVTPQIHVEVPEPKRRSRRLEYDEHGDVSRIVEEE